MTDYFPKGFRVALYPRGASRCLHRTGAAEEVDLGWLVTQGRRDGPQSVFDEIVKQNQEVLSLFHDLRLYQGGKEEFSEKPMNPHAA